MTPLLISISLILHLISFLFIILLWMKVSQMRDIEAKQKAFHREIEELFSSYLLEMKEENDRFMNSVQKVEKREKTVNSTNLNRKKVDAKMPQIKSFTNKQNLNAYKVQARNNQSVEDENNSSYSPPLPDDLKQNNTKEQSLASQVYSLQEEGYTTTEIAKKLNKGRTEVELLLKFRQES